MIAGADSLDDSDSPDRRGRARPGLIAPLTLGTFVRAHTFGDVRQFESTNIGALRRAWLCGAGPEPETAVLITIDSNISRSAS